MTNDTHTEIQEAYQSIEDMPEDMAKCARFFLEFKSVLGYDLPRDLALVFRNIHARITDDSLLETHPHLSSKKHRSRDWRGILHNAILGSCQRQAAQCLYHLNNLISLENLAINLIHTRNPKLAANQSMALSAEKIDFEFHALVTALKVYLSYTAGAIFAFFKQEHYSFNHYKSNLRTKQPERYSTAIAKLLDEQWPRLSLFYSIEDRRSVRDVIAHYRYVGAGWINIYGGEKIAAVTAMPQELLSNEVLQPTFKPHEIGRTGLGIAELMKDHTSYVISLSTALYQALDLYNAAD